MLQNQHGAFREGRLMGGEKKSLLAGDDDVGMN